MDKLNLLTGQKNRCRLPWAIEGIELFPAAR